MEILNILNAILVGLNLLNLAVGPPDRFKPDPVPAASVAVVSTEVPVDADW